MLLRPDSPTRCALCHDELGAEPDACPACAVTLHRECRASLPGCPTLDCRLGPPPVQSVAKDFAIGPTEAEFTALARRVRPLQHIASIVGALGALVLLAWFWGGEARAGASLLAAGVALLSAGLAFGGRLDRQLLPHPAAASRALRWPKEAGRRFVLQVRLLPHGGTAWLAVAFDASGADFDARFRSYPDGLVDRRTGRLGREDATGFASLLDAALLVCPSEDRVRDGAPWELAVIYPEGHMRSESGNLVCEGPTPWRALLDAALARALPSRDQQMRT